MIFTAPDDAPIAGDLLPDWRALLGDRADRLELEIGSGHGGFALAFAARHPERALVAVEQHRAFAADVSAPNEYSYNACVCRADVPGGCPVRRTDV